MRGRRKAAYPDDAVYNREKLYAYKTTNKKKLNYDI
jgi:hypothetical protein